METCEAETASRGSSNLLEVGAEYLALQQTVGLLLEIQKCTWPGTNWTEELEALWANHVDPLRDRMVSLRRAALSNPARSLAGLKAKATMLIDLIGDDPQSSCDQLTLSLCRDLIAYSAPSGGACVKKERGLPSSSPESPEGSNVASFSF